MARTAKSPVYVGDATMDKIAALQARLTAELGRKITYGEAVERAVDMAMGLASEIQAAEAP